MESTIFRMRDYSTREEWMDARSQYGNCNGASQAAARCNRSKYSSQTDLWEQEVGLKPAFKGNEATERGHKLESVVRERFMQKYGWLFELEYHEFGMYYRTDYPTLYATLDGVLKAKSNGIVKFPNGTLLTVKKDENVILEVKNPAPRDLDTYQAWCNGYPQDYRYQAAQQMFCSGIHKHLLIANITGDYQQGDVDEKFFLTTDEEVKEITDEIKVTSVKFWESVQKKERPTTVVEFSAQNLVPLKTSLKAGDIIDNFNDVVASVNAYAERYRGLKFTEDNLASGKSIAAEINKRKDEIDSVRKGIKKQWNEPLNAFEERCNKLIAILDDTRNPIAEQIKEIEDGGKAHKEQMIVELIDKTIHDEYPTLVRIMASTGGLAIDKKWLNKTTNWTEIKTGIKSRMDEIQTQWQMLYAFKETVDQHTWTAIFSEYLKSKRNVKSALAVKESLQKAKELEAEKSAPKTPVEPPQAKKEPSVTNPVITKVVEFSHTDPNEFIELIRYLKSHGFNCREVNRKGDTQ